MNEEMQALSKNETWDLVPHSPHRKEIGCRWIYKVKYNADGSVNHYKPRLVVVKKTVHKRNRCTEAWEPALHARTLYVVHKRELGT